MSFLVTGASGFLGQHLCQYLAHKNIGYRATVRSQSGQNQFATGDLNGFTDWKQLFNGVDTVIHTAAKTQVMGSTDETKKAYTRDNVELTKTLAAAAKAHQVKKFIFISSLKVNGEFTGEASFTADDKASPGDDYGVSKLLAEEELMKLHTPGAFDVTIIRPCLIYGKGVKGNFNMLVNLVRKKLPLPFGAIHNKRSFVSVDNLIDLILVCAGSSHAAGQVFLVSDGQDLSLTELLKQIGQALGISPLLLPVPVFLLKLPLKLLGKAEIATRLFGNLHVDISKNQKLLGWKPPFSTSDSLKKMLS